jgi:tripartite-type tricarboxylate transporter receptor subunit TctC
MIVPYAAGGGSDVIARNMAERMKASLGQPVIIENITGASGTIGTGRVAHARPDGYMLGIGNVNTHVMNGAMFALQYDVANDFEPVALLTTAPFLFLAKKALPADDLKGLIAWLKANPYKASFGTGGTTGLDHVAGVLFQKEFGTRFGFVPYRGGGAPALLDLMAGQIDMQLADPPTSLPAVRAGLVKAYAVMAKDRLAAARDIPTVDEAGLPGFYASFWYGLWAPAHTPHNIIAQLSAAVVNALADAGGARLADMGEEIFPRDQQTPEALRALQKAEIEKWWPVIKAAGIKAE